MPMPTAWLLPFALILTRAAPLCAQAKVGKQPVPKVGSTDASIDLTHIRSQAEQGNAEAQFRLGISYDRGEGVPQSDAEAAKWFRKAAEQGHADAQFNLGIHYVWGRGVPKSYAEAIPWYRKAAEQGHAEAQVKLGSH